MARITATEASKRFSDLLDAVEHHGESFTVVRRGRAIATISPAGRSSAAELKRFLLEHPPDERWAEDLAEVDRFVNEAPIRDPWTD